jgi:hypothetical protein
MTLMRDFYRAHATWWAASHCPSCQEITGFQTRHLLDLSLHDVFGFRYSEAASGGNPATGHGANVDTASPPGSERR